MLSLLFSVWGIDGCGREWNMTVVVVLLVRRVENFFLCMPAACGPSVTFVVMSYLNPSQMNPF